jgi:carotenoid cleavage dioxygenase-like enzyme
MSHHFPAEPMYSGFSAPSRFEADILDLEVVQGEVPKELNGTFYRVQPDPVWPPKMGKDIPLNGDGMITMFRFENGSVDFKCRYVRTEKFEAERKARRALFGTYRNPYTDDPSVEGLSRGTANTSVLWHGGKLMALKEDSHPVELDPNTLETKGSWDYHGALTSQTFTAHPKIDRVTGELIAYGFEAKGLASLDIAVYTINAAGEITGEEWMEAPYGCMIHDFGVTRDHVLMPITPLWTNLEQIKAGGPHYSWDGTRESALGVYSRKGGASDLRWFAGPTCHATHTLNAFADGRKIYYDTPTGEQAVFPFFPTLHGEAWDPAKAAPRLTRWCVDLDDNSGRIEHQPLTTVVGDFPKIDDRFGLSPVTKGWIVGVDEAHLDEKLRGPGSAMITNAIVEHDLQTGARKSFYVGDGASAQEPQFVPRRPDSPEGDGWLVLVVHRTAQMCSDLVVLDASDISAGPVATLRMPFRLRRGLHGCWVPADELP